MLSSMDSLEAISAGSLMPTPRTVSKAIPSKRMDPGCQGNVRICKGFLPSAQYESRLIAEGEVSPLHRGTRYRVIFSSAQSTVQDIPSSSRLCSEIANTE